MSLKRTAASITFVSIVCLTQAFGEPGRVAFTHVRAPGRLPAGVMILGRYRDAATIH